MIMDQNGVNGKGVKPILARGGSAATEKNNRETKGLYHGILKNNAGSGSQEISRSRSGIKWDEETIDEHNKERGTRMKIEEPNTPYHYCDSAEEYADVSPLLGLSSGSQSEECELLPQVLLEAKIGATDANSDECTIKFRRQLSERTAEAGKVNADELFDRLEELSQKQQEATDLQSFASSRSVHLSHEFENEPKNDSPEEVQKRKKFAAKRKAHYNEFLMMQRLRQSNSLTDSGEDDDDAKN